MKAIVMTLATLVVATGSAMAGGDRPTDIRENMGPDGLPVWVHPYPTVRPTAQFEAQLPPRIEAPQTVRSQSLRLDH